MAEMHPMLWARIADTRLSRPDYRIINLTTFGTPTSALADTEIVFAPNTDLAIWNYIAREILARDAWDREFVSKHCVFATGWSDIGYGMRATDASRTRRRRTPRHASEVVSHPREAVARRSILGAPRAPQDSATAAGAHWLISFEDFKKALEPYTLDFVAEVSRGDRDEPLDAYKAKLKALADQYASPSRKMVSYWTMGFNQHTRGTWVNEQAYMAHLLTGKQARPGSGAFSLTGQPSACGTAREVGTFSHRLPADMVVDSPEHRAYCERLWKLPARTLNPKVGSHITEMMRDLEDGKVKWLWVQVTNPFQSTANANHWIHAARGKDAFIVVSDVYPTLSCKVADLILPSAMIFEKWGGYGNSERHALAPAGTAGRRPQRRVADDGVLKRFTLAEVWGRQPVPAGRRASTTGAPNAPEAERMGYRRDQTLHDVLFATPENRKYRWPDPVARGHENHTVMHAGIDWFPEKALFEDYARFGRGHGHDLAEFDVYFRDDVRGLRWPVVNGRNALALQRAVRPYAQGQRLRLLGRHEVAVPRAISTRSRGPSRPRWPARPRSSTGRTPPRPRAPTRSSTSGSAPAACSSTGTLAP
jgi:nitrate reductase NapA